MLCSACLGAAPILAGESDYGVGLSLTHDSNIGLVDRNPRPEWTQVLMGGFLFREDTVDVNARVLAQIERRHFDRHTFSDDTGGFLEAATVWRIVPRQLAWTVEDTFREVRIDITATDTPTNRTKSNALSTGPDFTFALGSTDSLVVGGRYGRIDIENSIQSNRRYTAYVRGLHALSSQSTLSLSYEAGRAYFKPGAQAFTQIHREDWFGRFENRSSTNSATIDVGTTQVTGNGVRAPKGGRLVRLTLSEAFSSQSTLRVALADQISDTYTDLIAGMAGSTAPKETGVVVLSGTNIASADSFRSKRGDLAYLNDDGRFGYTLQGYGRRIDFVTLAQNYQEVGGTFLWAWLYSDAMRIYVSTAYTRRTFESFVREDKDRTYSTGVAFRPNRNVTITMDGARIERRSTGPLNGFVDNRVMLLLGYSTGPLYATRSRR
jgi:hypothetical protein